MEWLAGIAGAIFVFGTFWFWLAATLLFLGVLYWSENDNVIFPGILIGGFIWGWTAYNDITLSWWMVLGGAALYFVIGAFWSVVKWLSFLHKRGDALADHKLEFANIKTAIKGIKRDTNMFEHLTTAQYGEWRKFLSQRSFISYEHSVIIPSWKDKKSQMFGWVLYWPTSMLWTLLNDPLVRLVKWILRRLGGLYTRLANQVFAKLGVVVGEEEQWKANQEAEEQAARDKRKASNGITSPAPPALRGFE